ncbi:MAG: PiT family inorganic phosphate transporter [Phenylobacterium sp.]
MILTNYSDIHMNLILENYGTTLLIVAVIFALFMAWGIGANDVANAMGTSVGAGVITVKQAIMIAVVFEFLGAFLAGGEVTSTIRKGIIDTTQLASTPELLVFGMMSSLLAAGLWLFIASYFGWPVSTTHSIVGAIIGFAAFGIDPNIVNWAVVGGIVMSWITSPLFAGIVSFGLFRSVQVLILNTENPFERARRYVPYYMFLVGFVISLVTALKGLKHLKLDVSKPESFMISVGVGIIVMLIGKFLLRNVKDEPQQKDARFSNVEKIFSVLMLFTACAMAFAHGSNDVANAIGPLAAIHSVISSGGEIAAKSVLPMWILLLGAGGIVVGLATYGFKVMGTIGKKITELTPSSGFAAELAAAFVVAVATAAGSPVSTTHTLVGGVLGVGVARGIGALNLSIIRNIFLSWIITLPAGGILSIIFFMILSAIFVV